MDDADQSHSESESRPLVQLFTDGACSGNPGPGGWAFILRHPSSGREIERSGGARDTTNNRMELVAVIEGLKSLTRPSRVELFADSQYVVNGLREWLDGWIANDWKRGKKKREPVLNVDLWKQLDELRQVHTIELNWVRGHAGHPENERCDELAVTAMEDFR